LRPVDEIAADETVCHVVRRGSIGVRAAILHDQGNLGAAWNEIERGAQRPFVVVLDHDRAVEPAIGLRGREAVGVGVIPIHAAPVAHLEVVCIAPARFHEERPVAVVVAVNGKAVPMHDRRLRQRVDEIDPHALSALQHERRIRVVAPACTGRVAQWTAGSRGGGAPRCAREQCHRPIGWCQASEVSVVARHPEASAALPGAAEVGGRCDRLAGSGQDRARDQRRAQRRKALQ
jgi:hypothetical protein